MSQGFPGNNPFQGLNNAPITERGTFFENGTYLLEFQRLLVKNTQNVGLAFIVEFKVLQSNNPAHPIGSSGTWFQKMSNQAVALSAIASWYAAQLGYNTSPEAMAHFDANVRPKLETLVMDLAANAAALQGYTTVKLHVSTAKTKKGLDFNLHVFSPWKPAQGWQPEPTPAVAAEPQRPKQVPMVQQGQPPAYPQAPYGAPAGQVYGQPPQAPAYPSPAPYGVPPQAPSPYGQPPQAPPAPGQAYGAPSAQPPAGVPGMPPAGTVPGMPGGWPGR